VSLSAPGCRPALAHGGESARTGPRRRFAHPVKQVFENRSIVADFVFRGEQQGQALSFVSELVKAEQGGSSFGLSQFFQIFLAEEHPVIGAGVIPAAQFIGRGDVAESLVHGGALLGEAAGPEAVHEQAHAIRAHCRFVDSFYRYCHGCAPPCSIIVRRRAGPCLGAQGT
jgi:hypothetical protein